MAAAPDREPELSLRTRARNLERMRSEPFDILVVGGGATGAGVALDAVTRGLSVALLEKGDFASGTSSRSSKLIHGGLRYLEHLELRLVREALRERELLRRNAPHLSRPMPFLVPVYTEADRSPLGNRVLKLRAGLALYDRLASSKDFPSHQWLSPGAAREWAPHLSTAGLRGAFLYYDGVTDDARLVIEIIKAAASRGAVVANYAAVTGLVRRDGDVTGAEAFDAIAAEPLAIRARVVIGAAGVWADELARMADPGATPALRPSKGIHVVLAAERLENRAAVLIPSLAEQRFLFVIPWLGCTLIGTTDTDYAGPLDAPSAGREEVNRLIESAARSFPGASLTAADVISSFAGLRPLVAAGGARRGATKEMSRRDEIAEGPPGMISILGGKLTTWRAIAQRAVDLAAKRVAPRDAKPVAGSSATVSLANSQNLPANVAAEAARAAYEFGVPSATVEHLIQTYGGNYLTVLQMARAAEELKRPLIEVGACGSGRLPHIEAEVVYAVRYEMAMTVDDFLSRRTRLRLLSPDAGAACAARVAELLARETASFGPDS